MAVVPFLGLRGSNSFATDERPQSFREMYLYLYPNGSMPITALQGLVKSSKVSDPVFHWFEKDLAKMCADVTAVKTSDNSTDYTVAGAAGDILYVRMSDTDSQNFRIGHQAVLIDETDPGVHLQGKVIGVQNGGSAYVAIRLYKADDRGTTVAASTKTDLQLLNYGNVNPEGGNVPDTIMFNPYKRSNVTQIFRTPLEITRTAKETRLRTVDQYREAKREALELHGMQQEWTQIWGVYKDDGVGANGQPERSTRGLLDWIYTYAPENVFNYRTDTDFAGKTWEEGGLDYFEKILERMFLWGETEKLCVCGSQIIQGVQKLVRQWGHYKISNETKMFGYKVMSLETPFGVLHFKSHPLMRYVESTRRLGIVFEPKRFERRYITDTMYKEDINFRKGGFSATDALKEEYLTECGYEYHHVRTASVLLGVGSDNTAEAV